MKLLYQIAAVALLAICPAANAAKDLADSIRHSLVYLNISNSAYEQLQPWKQTDVSQEEGFGVAVGPNRILTTAENVTHATYIQARAYEQNAFIPAKVIVVDYEYNLCLLELDKDSLTAPLKPVVFSEAFPKGGQLTTYWLASNGDITSARSSLDRAEVVNSTLSFAKSLSFIVSNTSRPFGDGEACTHNDDVIGLANWGNGSDAGIIPAETINRFLSQTAKDTYGGFAAAGFETYDLLDPAMRKYLKLPPDVTNGVYVNSVYTLGTGAAQLKVGDVIVTIDGQTINAYGRYKNPQLDLISFHHLILRHLDGETISFEVFRDGKLLSLAVKAASIKSKRMLVPHYLYGQQPVYYVTGGFVFQQLTRDYLTMWGEDWQGKVPPHLFNYYFTEAFKPKSDRSDIIVLSYVLPAEINQGYQQLARLVVDSIDGKKPASMVEFMQILESQGESPFHEIKFEMDAPTVVIPKKGLEQINAQIAQIYGISKQKNVN